MLKMVVSSVLFCFALWTVAVIGSGPSCPVLCICSDKEEHHLAQCTFKDLTRTPIDLPPNVTILNLSNNRLGVIAAGSFDRVTAVTSLWIAQNTIVSIEAGSLAPLIHLHNFDVSHNQLVDFPWEDLRKLPALQMLKMNHNRLVTLPRDAFVNLNDLESLRLNNNQFITVAQGTFDGLTSVSHLQLYNNPFTCDCSVDWLRDWILTHTVTVPEPSLIVCDNPQQLKGVLLVQAPRSQCTGPDVIVTAEPSIDHTDLYEDTSLILTCELRGNPEPAIVWRIQSKRQRETILVTPGDDDSAESTGDSSIADKPFKVFGNGTLVMFHISAKDSGNYSCSATNAFGTAEDTVAIEVRTLPKPTPTEKGVRTYIPTKTHQVVTVTSVSSAPSPPPAGEGPDTTNDTPTPPSPPPAPPPPDPNPGADKQTSAHDSKCGLTSKTRYVSNHGFNGTLEDVKEYTFDFGVIALSVSETEARVRLNPLLVARARSRTGEEGLYLCLSADPENPAMQWSGIEAGVNTYVFADLRPATNYSLCFTYTGRDCDVQVVFSTRRQAANLLIIVSVCMVLLTVSTVPLLVATCYHLVLKYRGKTYKLILKARDQYQVETNLGGHFHLHAPYPSESRRKINGSELEEEMGKLGGRRGREEDDEDEGSQVTESFSMSRAHTGDCEASSEYSDRLPLGAEAVNITSDYRYPSL
ncbi:immunoglobulin superfamily containing leucine-rich repeat protein 2-like [Gadus macrocephalus]|uniref:immunoglobulin superfamily containing leucine-rich repeat protein 2-like n=1 Tax=Gadus macrocephalus TaxID=80720 RepID=UPI0028CBA320|nr:immunoglobulin superfamily containing leucine-rich repeat protein 2-like [Gadus macrocephalus]